MSAPEARPLSPLVLYAGGVAVIGQTILVRELMVSFYGTEFALAAALTCWLAFIPAGGHHVQANQLDLLDCRAQRTL